MCCFKFTLTNYIVSSFVESIPRIIFSSELYLLCLLKRALKILMEKVEMVKKLNCCNQPTSYKYLVVQLSGENCHSEQHIIHSFFSHLKVVSSFKIGSFFDKSFQVFIFYWKLLCFGRKT